jgi:hypothetical protein
MASADQTSGLQIGRGVLLSKSVASGAGEADSRSSLFMDLTGTNDSVVCIHSSAAGTTAGEGGFRVYVEDPTVERDSDEATVANSFLMFSNDVAANTVLRINVPGGFGSRMFCVFDPDTGTATVKIWAWSASSQGRR